MKIEAQLLELAELRGELGKIALAIAVVILVGVVAAVIQDLRRDSRGPRLLHDQDQEVLPPGTQDARAGLEAHAAQYQEGGNR